MKPYTKKTLAELLGHSDPTIYRNSMSILKRLQRITDEIEEQEDNKCRVENCNEETEADKIIKAIKTIKQ